MGGGGFPFSSFFLYFYSFIMLSTFHPGNTLRILTANSCFVFHDDEWIPVALRVYPLVKGEDLIEIKTSLPHGLKYYSRLR